MNGSIFVITLAYFCLLTNHAIHEALFLSPKEEQTINGIGANIQQEYQANIDTSSQHIIVSHMETLLSYLARFYERQFITRKVPHHKLIERLETLLHAYLSSEYVIAKGLPTVQYIAGALHVSPNYLSRLLKMLRGQSTQQFIQDKMIDIAKEKLSTTDLSVSEIAYELGFEHPQSFTKLFKRKTDLSPMAFRLSFT